MSENEISSSVETAQKITWGDKIWQFVRFAVITGGIFAVSFLALNFQAYSAILASLINPEAQQERGDILIEAAESHIIDEQLLLPTQQTEEKVSYAWLDQPVVPTDNRLSIPKLGLSVPIVSDLTTEHIKNGNWKANEDMIQKGLEDGVVKYPGSAVPGQNGNVFITGHSSYYSWAPGEFKDVFAILRQLEVGDIYYVYYNQKKYTYQISEKKIIPPNDVSVLQQPKDRKISTLMTCDPPGSTTNRLVMVAEDITEINPDIENHESHPEVDILNAPALPI